MNTEPYTPDEAELIGCYAGAMEEQDGENYATAKADAERGIAKIKADAVLAAAEEVLELHQRVPNSTSALYPNPLCTCGQNHPCPTVQSVRSAIERSE